MKKSKLFKQLALGVGFSAVLVLPAMAAPIASFDYTQEFEFVEPIAPSGVKKTGTTSGIDDIDGVTKLAWGNGNKKSSLVINPESGNNKKPSGMLTQGSIITATDINSVILADGPSIVHNNFVINGPSLKNTSAQDNVILTPFASSALPAQEITFGIDFFETTNSRVKHDPNNPKSCPTLTRDKHGCGDIFALSGGLLGTPTILNLDVQAFLIDQFLLDGYIYDVYITAVGLRELTSTECSTVGADLGCIGFTTFENKSNKFDLKFGIVAREAPMPEPATLALLAGGLLLMGLSRRKKAGALSA